jgi:hypothetical protein
MTSKMTNKMTNKMTSKTTARTSRLAPSISATLTAALLVLATGCQSSKTKATPENFIQALNSHFQTHSECLFPEPPRFPLGTSDKTQTRQFDSLVKAQLLTVAQEPAIHVSRYTVTTVGTRYAPRFCYGHRTVTAIDSFTPPAQANGFPETRVTYRYTLQDVPIWAKTPEVQAAFPAMAKATTQESTAQATLAGTLAGWQVPD